MPRWPEENYISLASLIQSGVLTAGGHLSVTAYGETHTAVLLHSGAIQFKGRDFASPSSFSLFVKQIYNPTKKADDGWKSVCYKGKPLEDFRKMFRISHGHFVGGACTSKKRSKKKATKAEKRVKKTARDSPSRKHTPTDAIPRVVGSDPEHQIRHNHQGPEFCDIHQEKSSANFCRRVILFGSSNASRTDSEKNSTTASNKASFSMSTNGVVLPKADAGQGCPVSLSNGVPKKSPLSKGGTATAAAVPVNGNIEEGKRSDREGGSLGRSNGKTWASNCSTKIKLFRKKGNASEGRNEGECQGGQSKGRKRGVSESKSKRTRDWDHSEDEGGGQPSVFRSKNRGVEKGLGAGASYEWGKTTNNASQPVQKNVPRGVLTGVSGGGEKDSELKSGNRGSVSSMDSFVKGPLPSDITSKNRLSSSASRDNVPRIGDSHSEGLNSGFRLSQSNPTSCGVGGLHHQVNCMSIGKSSREGDRIGGGLANHSLDSDVYWMANSPGLKGPGGVDLPSDLVTDSNSTDKTTDGTGRKAGCGNGGNGNGAFRFDCEVPEMAKAPCSSPAEAVVIRGQARGGDGEESCAVKPQEKTCRKRKDPTFNWWRCTNCGKFRKVMSSGSGQRCHQNTFVCDYNEDERYNRCPVPEEKRVDFSGQLSVQAFLEFSHRPPLDRCTANEFYHDLSVFLQKVENQQKQATEVQNRQFDIDLFSLYKAVVQGGGLHVFCHRMDLKSFRLLKIMLATSEVFVPGGCVAAAKEFIKFLAGYERACFQRDFEFYEQMVHQPIICQSKKFARKITA